MYLNVSVSIIFAELVRAFALPNCGVSSENVSPNGTRITGENDVAIGQYPWVVSIFESLDCSSFSHKCGGAIISEHWVVTAGHCVCPRDPDLYLIYAGINDVSQLTVPSGRNYGVSAIFMHPEYNQINYQNDIALLRTLTPIHVSTSDFNINSICLPSVDAITEKNAVTAGWGLKSEDNLPKTMRKVHVSIIENSVCNKIYDPYPGDGIDIADEKLICAVRQEVGSCVGDSGGPLMQKNERGVYTLIGIVSHGREICSEPWLKPPYVEPSIFTKVTKYVTWMKKIMEQSEEIRPEFNTSIDKCYDSDRMICLPNSFQ